MYELLGNIQPPKAADLTHSHPQASQNSCECSPQRHCVRQCPVTLCVLLFPPSEPLFTTTLPLKRHNPEVGNRLLSQAQVGELPGPKGTEWTMGKPSTMGLFRVKGHYGILVLCTAFFRYCSPLSMGYPFVYPSTFLLNVFIPMTVSV